MLIHNVTAHQRLSCSRHGWPRLSRRCLRRQLRDGSVFTERIYVFDVCTRDWAQYGRKPFSNVGRRRGGLRKSSLALHPLASLFSLPPSSFFLPIPCIVYRISYIFYRICYIVYRISYIVLPPATPHIAHDATTTQTATDVLRLIC